MRLSGMLRPTSKSNMTGAVILLLVVLPGMHICEGQNVHLTGSAGTAVAGQPFTFTCRNRHGFDFVVDLIVELQNGTSQYQFFPGLGVNCRIDFGYDPDIYNFTCSRDMITLTILDVDYNTYQSSNWTCLDLDYYEISNIVTLDVNVPLVAIGIMNSTNFPMAVTENDDVTLVCETNPTIPSSTIVWMKENNTLSEDVTSLSRPVDGGVVAVSMAKFTVSCDDHLTRIQCSGLYKSTQITSKSQTLFVHCITKEDASKSGATFGAGVGVGMTLCLLPLLVAVAVYIVWWRRHQTQEDKTQPTESTPSRAARPQLDSRQTTNIYEGMDESTKQRNNTTYEDIHVQVYENTA
ncbi:uncharacterized protein [Haliotis cracherodii]|uniref:uncharacterized protein n=1 Tax=Haliotis cracherodii TaxID=6455 RepID=UPI0039E81738